MEARIEPAADEVRRLKTCISDLVGVFGLRAIWCGGEPSRILNTLLDVLVGTLHLDFAYARVREPLGGASVESVRVDPERGLAVRAPEFGQLLEVWLKNLPPAAQLRIANPLGSGDVTIVAVRLGLQDEIGVLVAGSGRADFPLQTEKLLLNVAANQAAIGLHEGRRLTQRAMELVAANEELNKEIAERKLAEEALRRSEAYLTEAQKVSHTGSWAARPGIRDFTYLSDELFRIFGLDAPGVRTLDRDDFFDRVVHPDDGGRLREAWSQAWRDKVEYSGEFRILLSDGAIRHVQAIGHPILDEAGELVEYVGTAVDVTERKRIEEERAAHVWFLESMDRINRAMQGTNDLERMMSDVLDAVLEIFAGDRAWLVYPCDPEASSWRPVMEHTRSEFPGAFAMGTDLPVDTEVAAVFRSARAATGAVLFGPGYERPVPVQVGERFSIRSTMVMAVYPKVDRPYLFGLHQCSRPRQWTAQEQRLFEEIGWRLADSLTSLLMFRGLRDSERKLEMAQRIAHVGHWDRDLESGRVAGSEEWFRIYGREFEERAAQVDEWHDRWLATIHVEDLARVTQVYEATLNDGAPFDVEYRLLRPNGEVRIVHSRGGLTRDESGRPRRMFGMTQDITELRRAEAERLKLEERLRQAEKLEAIGTLAGGIAHDFNNILGAVLGHGELAQGKAGESGALREHLDQVIQAGGRGKRLVEQIFAFSRSGAGERIPVHVQSVVEETLDLLAASLPPSIRLEKMLRTGDTAVAGDATRLHQVTMNLCANAVQAMAVGGVLSVTLERTDINGARELTHATLAPGHYVCLRVRDTGTGIPAAVLKHIFDPFFTTKRVGEGTGLGLSLVYGIVTDFGGAVDVETREGVGTTFTVWLPACGEVAPCVMDEAGLLPQGNGEAVMIVDDESPLVTVAEEMLAGLGYEPFGFSSSTDALAALCMHPDRYDIVLTDEMMPDMTGTDLARAIRRVRADIPILLMSGYSGWQLTERARSAGVSEVLRKPLVSRDIAEPIARVLVQRGARREDALTRIDPSLPDRSIPFPSIGEG